jgi:transcriptional regulator LmrA/YxaF-like protein
VQTHSHLEAGCAVEAVTLASDSPVLRERAGQIFNAWRHLLSRILAEGGVPRGRSNGLTAGLFAAC